MKKCLFIYMAVQVCFAENAFAQPQVYTPFIHKQVQAPLPVKQAENILSKIKPVYTTASQQAFALRNNTQGQISKLLAECPAKKIAQPILTLNAERINNFTADLQWETKYAFRAKGFNIERSLADSFHFASVHFAKASAGAGLKNKYRLPDRNDYDGISFYRIRQLNHDSGFIYSNIVSVDGYNTLDFNIYPNPAIEKISIGLTAKVNGNCTIMLYDASGKIIQQQLLNCSSQMRAVKSLDISKLIPGTYQVVILMPDKTLLTEKFIKQ